MASYSVFISKLPALCTSYELASHFGAIGPIKRCFLIKNDDKEFTGSAQVTYQDEAHAAEAVCKLHDVIFKDDTISVEISKDERHKNERVGKKRSRSKDSSSMSEKFSPKKLKEDIKEEEKYHKQEDIIETPREEEKYHREQIGRVIVRNLSFEATEADVQKFFNTFGIIDEVHFPKNRGATSKHRGCTFIQYTNFEDAERAIKEANLHKFMGRQISVDHASPKGKYQLIIPPSKAKKEVHSITTVTIAKTDDGTIDSDDIKKEEMSDSEEESLFKKDGWKGSVKDIKEEKPREDPKSYKHAVMSRDVEEGRTLFVSRLSLDTTTLSVNTALSKFGELKYVMLVMDKFTEQSKGTAFAQFKDREAADKCLEAAEDPSREDELMVDGRVMEVRRAFGRGDGQDNKQPTEPKGKDNRNLYLAKEGFIREGTQSATGVSPYDIKLRRQREQVKQKLLENLHMFVSPVRLCINNLPEDMKDPALRQLIKKHAPARARITESRIMRYLGQVDAQGVAVSRGYGFVSFTRHQDALDTLRTVNNNPTVFSRSKRPIVEFSIESKAVLNLKKKRLQRSKDCNKSAKDDKTKATKKTKPAAAADGDDANVSRKQFTGFTANREKVEPGKKLHKHLGAKVRRRNTKNQTGFKNKGNLNKKGSTKNKKGSTKNKKSSMKKNVKKYTKV